MSCNSNAKKTRLAAVKCGISKAASITAYVVGGALIGGAVTAGSPTGLVAGAVLGGIAIRNRFKAQRTIAEIQQAVDEGTAKYLVTDPVTGTEYATLDGGKAADFALVLGAEVGIVAPGGAFYDKERPAIPPAISTSAREVATLRDRIRSAKTKERVQAFQDKLKRIDEQQQQEWTQVKQEMRGIIARQGQWDQSGRFMRLKTEEGNAIVLSKAEVDFYKNDRQPGDSSKLAANTRSYYEGDEPDKTAPAFTIITDGEWNRKFRPERNEHNAYRLYDTPGEIDGRVPLERIWTLREEDGKAYLSPGIHGVNKLGYYVTQNEWQTPNWQVEIEEG